MTIHEVHPCASGCGRGLTRPGYCARCGEEIAALHGLWMGSKPQVPWWRQTFRSLFDYAMSVVAFGLLLYILRSFAAGFMDTWSAGWRPWQ